MNCFNSLITKYHFFLDEPVTSEELSPEPISTPPPPPPLTATQEPIVVNKILLVDTENVSNDEYEQTPELKV